MGENDFRKSFSPFSACLVATENTIFWKCNFCWPEFTPLTRKWIYALIFTSIHFRVTLHAQKHRENERRETRKWQRTQRERTVRSLTSHHELRSSHRDVRPSHPDVRSSTQIADPATETSDPATQTSDPVPRPPIQPPRAPSPKRDCLQREWINWTHCSDHRAKHLSRWVFRHRFTGPISTFYIYIFIYLYIY